MTARQRRKASSVMRQTSDLAAAAPLVVAHRVARMAAAGPSPSRRDRAEFTRMVLEKQAAFGQAWMAMALQSAVAFPALMGAMARAWAHPWNAAAWWNPALAGPWQTAALGVWAKGLAPVRAAAVANARRLSRR